MGRTPHFFHWLGWKGRLPVCVLFSATAVSVYFWALAILDTQLPDHIAYYHWYGVTGIAAAHHLILRQTLHGFYVGAILGVPLWRLLLAGTKGGMLVCVLLSAMVFSAYFKALVILDTERPGAYETMPEVRTDEDADGIDLALLFQTVFGFCAGTVPGLLFWFLLHGITRYRLMRSQ